MDMTITKERLVSDLRALGITPGDHLAIGVSLRKIGTVQGGAETFIDAVLEVVGENGTVMTNTYTANFRMSAVRFMPKDQIFDARTTPANTGAVAEALRRRPQALRSCHPVTSVSAAGELAEFLTDNHDENASCYLPFSRLAEVRGKALYIGLGDNLVGLRHEAQYLAGLLTVVPFKRGTAYFDSEENVKGFRLRDKGGCTTRLPDLVDSLRERGQTTEGVVGQAKSLLVSANEALTIMADLLREKPSRNLCGDITCLWCREIERRMDLYGEIQDPHYFQKNAAIIRLISYANRARLADWAWVAKIRRLVKIAT
jgi:aminoglycoside 3-N-acetyltransferase